MTRTRRGGQRSVADPDVLAELTARIDRVGPDAVRGWGRMTPHQMMVHLAENHEAVLGRMAWTTPSRAASPIVKFLALRLPLQWTRSLNFGADPASRSLDPSSFAADRARAAATLAELAGAGPEIFLTPHPIFGLMTRAEWHRWAFLHTDHHLRQFGR